MANANKQVAMGRRARHLWQRFTALAAQTAQTEQRLRTVLYPARLHSAGMIDESVFASRTEFEAWRRLDAEWLTRRFRQLELLQWLPIVLLLGGLAVAILFIIVLGALGVTGIGLTLWGMLLFLIAMAVTGYGFRVSGWAQKLTGNEQELRALFRLAWTTRDRLPNNQASVCALLFQPYLKNPLGAWFIRETLARLAQNDF